MCGATLTQTNEKFFEELERDIISVLLVSMVFTASRRNRESKSSST